MAWCRLFSVQVNFNLIISGASLNMISVRLARFSIYQVTFARSIHHQKLPICITFKRSFEPINMHNPKKCNELSKRRSMRFNYDSGSEGEEVSPLESESVKTTESMRKLAEDSLAMGELLGLKVVANKEDAIKRITQSLKSARVPKSNYKTN